MTEENTETNKDNLHNALYRAQKEFQVVKRDKVNTYHNSHYASLQSIMDATRPALLKEGLLYYEVMEGSEGARDIVAVLKHTSGEELRSSMPIPQSRLDEVQKLGSWLSYMRRYLYRSLTGVAVDDDDDDGNKATQPARQMNNSRNGFPAMPQAIKERHQERKETTVMSKATRAELISMIEALAVTETEQETLDALDKAFDILQRGGDLTTKQINWIRAKHNKFGA